MKKSKKFSSKVRERAVRMVRELRGECPSLWAAIESIAPKIVCVPQTLHEWVKRVEVDTGVRGRVTTSEVRRVKELERENMELRRANEMLKLASAFCAKAKLDRWLNLLKDFIDKHRDTYGVEPDGKALQVARRPIGAMLHCSANRTDAAPGAARQSRAHHDQRCQGLMPVGPG